jgi:4'-phosphopantetheinyl transferase
MTRQVLAVHLITGPDGPWDPVRRDFVRTGVALVHGSTEQWQQRDGESLRGLLGRDFDRERRSGPGGAQFVASRLLVRHLVAQLLGTLPGAVELGQALTGRLYVRGCDQIDLSLSHTGDVMLVGVTSLGRIGVDVEPADRPLSGSGVERQMSTVPELAEVADLPEPARNDRLVRRRTLKEAYTKALGLGLAYPFNGFGFDLDTEPPRLLSADGSPVPGRSWSFRTLAVGPSHVGALALHDRTLGSPGLSRAPADLDLTPALDPRALHAVRRALHAPAP